MRQCRCSGNCESAKDNLNRREFIGLVSAGTAATLLATPAWGAFELPAAEWERWRRELFAPAPPRLYRSNRHTDARLHLGGIGTGNFEIGSDGQLTTWQLFNTLKDGQVPFCFAVKNGATARLLQTAGGPDWPRVQQIEMTGEYPFADLRFRDSGLPVQLSLTAFSPFAPLDAGFSATPLAIFVFRIQNPTPQTQTVSLAALMQNPVGYEADGENKSALNACFGSNRNEPLSENGATGLFLGARAASAATLDKPVSLYSLPNLQSLQKPPPDRPLNLALEILDGPSLPVEKITNSTHTVIWLEEPGNQTPASFLRAARQAVQAGATLVFSGKTMPLLDAFASWTRGQPLDQAGSGPDIIFEDFERGYDNWKVEGDAFGQAPARGTLPNQQPVSGFLGQGLVNSFLGGDDTTGRLVSKPFTIERRFIRFLVGGGHYDRTQIRLVTDGKIVRTSAGKDNERLEPVLWDVGSLLNQRAHIEIIDQQKGGWGHVNVDQIEFSDLPADRDVMVLLDELLPARFRAIQPAPDSNGGSKAVQFDGLALKPEATDSTAANGLCVLARPLGKGRVVVAAGAVLDPAAAGSSAHRQLAYAFLCGLVGAQYTGSAGPHPKAPGFGNLVLAAMGGRVTVLPAFEDWNEAWRMLAAEGRFLVPDQPASLPTPLGRTTNGAVAATVTVPPGGTVEVPFLLAWHYPNKYNSSRVWMGCHYATRWADARVVLREAAAHWSEWRARTEQFRTTFYDSTLPYWLLDAVTANAAILRHIGVVFRIANGDVYGWEGSNGCCDPTCTHVWGYEQTLARLFPDLEKDMRRIDFKHQQREDGGINNRTQVPSPPHPTGEQPFADGHASCILKAYREALNHPDDGFLKEYWTPIQRAVEYLVGRDAKTAAGQPAGILQDDQWNTYDEALHGVTTFISGYYLAALRAGEAWARRLGETTTADRWHAIFEQGQRRLIELCWNGEYFQQHLPDYMSRQGEVGPGCLADQLIGQWWAHQLGLGYILPPDKVVAALRSVFKYNFKSDLTGWKHIPRAFAGAKDKGLVICTWPKGGRPANVMLYSDEVWTGIEYQVAAHMIYEGLIEPGFAIVKAARDRYDGIPRAPIGRNPWNEIECGGHYARAMSSWTLLLALSGFEYDGPRRSLRFTPRHSPKSFKSFFAGPEAWGSLKQQVLSSREQRNEVHVSEGRFSIAQITLETDGAVSVAKATMGGAPLASTFAVEAGKVVVSFPQPSTITAGQTLAIQLTLKKTMELHPNR